MIRWRIYYGDDSTFSHDQGSPWDAPRQNVQVIIQCDPRVGWTWCSGGDFFYWDPDTTGWNTTGEYGMYDYLMRVRHPVVLFGRQLSDDRWRQVFARAKAEAGNKQGWLVTEDRRDDN